jgi:hypothetical protein
MTDYHVPVKQWPSQYTAEERQWIKNNLSTSARRVYEYWSDLGKTEAEAIALAYVSFSGNDQFGGYEGLKSRLNLRGSASFHLTYPAQD